MKLSLMKRRGHLTNDSNDFIISGIGHKNKCGEFFNLNCKSYDWYDKNSLSNSINKRTKKTNDKIRTNSINRMRYSKYF